MIEADDARQEKAILSLEGKAGIRNLIDVIRSKRYNYSWCGKNEPIHYDKWDWMEAEYFDIDIGIDCEAVLLLMPERMRAIFILYYFFDWNHERIAELFGYDRSCVSKLMKKERLRLGVLLERPKYATKRIDL
jgi:DNA-directed RNA polymerase specialized sigma24 family protein